MTNRKRSEKQNKSIRFVDLSFDLESQRPLSVSLDNLSTASEGGYRRNVSVRGGRGGLLSQFSFNKSLEDQQQMDEDIHRIIQQEYMEQSAAPRWAIDVSRESTHSGESPLFIHRLLPPSKVEQQFHNMRFSNALFHMKSTSSLSKSGAYYRPNSTHQYLTNTELKDASTSEIHPKLGKPTRTTLLRARQRCNSAPVNAYEKRREMRKKAEDKKELFTNILNSRGFGGLQAPDGESLHSFLIGARYNRAHYLDAKSVSEYGVYMPRGNPMGCFVVKSPPMRHTNADDRDFTPATPPESLESLSESESEDLASEMGSADCTPSPPPLPAAPSTNAVPRPPSAAKPAWDDPCSSCKMCQEEQLSHDHSSVDREPHVILQEVLSLEDGLNIKGVGVGSGSTQTKTRPSSARPGSARSATYDPKAQQTTVLPQVHVQGMSMLTSPPTVKTKETIDQLQMANQPSPGRSHITTKEISDKLQLENIHVRKIDLGKSQEGLKVEKPEVKQAGKPKVLKVDKAVNVPSVSGEPSNLNDFVLIGNRSQAAESTVTKQDEAKPEDGNLQTVSDHNPNAASEVEVDNKSKKTRSVRFADDLNPTAGEAVAADVSGKEKSAGSDAKFFLTEDDDNAPVVTGDKKKSQSANNSATHEEGDEGTMGNNSFMSTEDKPVADESGELLEGEADKNSLSVNISDNVTADDNPTRLNTAENEAGTEDEQMNQDSVRETPRDDEPVIAVDISPKASDSAQKD